MTRGDVSPVPDRNPADLAVHVWVSHVDMIGSNQHIYRLTATDPDGRETYGAMRVDVLGDDAFVNFIEVDSAFRRRGVATALYRELHAWASRENLRVVHGMLTEESAAAWSSIRGRLSNPPPPGQTVRVAALVDDARGHHEAALQSVADAHDAAREGKLEDAWSGLMIALDQASATTAVLGTILLQHELDENQRALYERSQSLWQAIFLAMHAYAHGRGPHPGLVVGHRRRPQLRLIVGGAGNPSADLDDVLSWRP